MSTIWTPSGERPVGRPTSEQDHSPASARPGETEQADVPPGKEEAAARLRELTEELLRTPAAVVVANHAMGLYELAALHLAQRPPNLAEARLAIDAFGALLDGLRGRLGDSEPALREFLARIRLAFVQATSTTPPTGGAGPGGDRTSSAGAPASGEQDRPPPPGDAG